MKWVIAMLALASVLVGRPAYAQANRICVEEVSGVCLKFEEAPKRQAAPKPAPAPAPASPAQIAERNIGLSAADRLNVQAALRAEGFYQGAIDGAIGPQSRRAIRNWQTARGDAATGYLTASQFGSLSQAAAAARDPQPAAAPAPPPPEPEPEPVVLAPQPVEPEPVAPVAEEPHPQMNRVYRDGHVTLHGARIDVEVERIDAERAEIRFKLEDNARALEDDCVVRISEQVTCYFRRPGFNMLVLSGKLPNLVASESEVRLRVPTRANSEVFELW